MTEPAATVKTVPFDPDAAAAAAADPNAQTTVNQNNGDNTVVVDPTKAKTQEELDHEAAMIKKAETGTNNAANSDPELFAGKYKTKEEFDKAILSAYHKKHGDKVEEAFKTLTGDLSSESNTNVNDSQTPEEKAVAEKAAADKAAAEAADTRTEAQKTADAAKELADKEAADAADASAAADKSVQVNANMETFVGEFNESGKLSDDSYGKLEEAGFDKPMVDTYMSGIAAQRDGLFNLAGGKESFFQMTEWAAEDGGMDEASINLFNEDLNSGDMAKMSRAITTLKTSFAAAGQKTAPGKRIEPTNPNDATGITGYTHIDELKADQKNPLYKTSAAFRATVKEKIRLGRI